MSGFREDQIPMRTAVHEFARLFSEFDARGYFEWAFGKDCVDDPSGIDPADVINARLPGRDLWPLDHQDLTDNPDRFLDLIEVLHDLVAAPRSRRMHAYAGCGWHYGDFSPSIGRSVYRWHVNRILERSGVD